MGLKDKLKQIDFTKFKPYSLTTDNVKVVGEQVSVPHSATGYSYSFDFIENDESKRELIFSDLYFHSMHILYMFSQTKPAHDGKKEFDSRELLKFYTGHLWSDDIKDLSRLLLLGIACGILSPLRKTDDGFNTSFLFTVPKTLSPKDPNFSDIDDDFWNCIHPEILNHFYTSYDREIIDIEKDVCANVSDDMKTLHKLNPDKIDYYTNREDFLYSMAHLRYKDLIKPQAEMTLSELVENFDSISEYGKRRLYDEWDSMDKTTMNSLQSRFLGDEGELLSEYKIKLWSEYPTYTRGTQRLIDKITIAELKCLLELVNDPDYKDDVNSHLELFPKFMKYAEYVYSAFPSSINYTKEIGVDLVKNLPSFKEKYPELVDYIDNTQLDKLPSNFFILVMAECMRHFFFMLTLRRFANAL